MMGKMEIVGATDCSQVTLWFQSKLMCWYLHVSGGFLRGSWNLGVVLQGWHMQDCVVNSLPPAIVKYVSLLSVMHVHEHETWHAWSYKRASGFTLYKGLTWGANPANLKLHPTKLRRTKNNQNRGSSQAGLDIDGLVRSDCRRKGSSPSGKSQYEKPSRTAPVGGWFTPVLTRSHPSISSLPHPKTKAIFLVLSSPPWMPCALPGLILDVEGQRISWRRFLATEAKSALALLNWVCPKRLLSCSKQTF